MTHQATDPVVPVNRRLQLSKARSTGDGMSSRSQAVHTDEEQPDQLLLCDFDNTIADFDTGHYLLSSPRCDAYESMKAMSGGITCCPVDVFMRLEPFADW